MSIKIREIIFFIFSLILFFNCIFYRDFSYIKLGIPFLDNFYITEYFISIVFIYYGVFSLSNKKFLEKDVLKKIIIPIGLIIWSILNFLLINPGFSYEKLRDFAASFYILFYLLIVFEFNDISKTEKMFKTICVAAFISIINILFKFFILKEGLLTTTLDTYRYGNYEYVGISFLISLAFIKLINNRSKKIYNLILFLLSFFTINFLIVHRSASLGLAFSILTIIYFALTNMKAKKFLNFAIYFLLISIFFTPLLFLNNSLLNSGVARILSIVNFNDPNISWRLLIWKSLLNIMTLKDFLVGKGWGYEKPSVSFNFLDYSNYGVHNSFIFFLFHIGIIGIIFLLATIFNVYLQAIKILNNKKHTNSIIYQRILTLLAGHFGLFIFAVYNVVLEGPYMSIVFWTSLGLLNNYCNTYFKLIKSNA